MCGSLRPYVQLLFEGSKLRAGWLLWPIPVASSSATAATQRRATRPASDESVARLRGDLTSVARERIEMGCALQQLALRSLARERVKLRASQVAELCDAMPGCTADRLGLVKSPHQLRCKLALSIRRKACNVRCGFPHGARLLSLCALASRVGTVSPAPLVFRSGKVYSHPAQSRALAVRSAFGGVSFPTGGSMKNQRQGAFL